MQSTRLKGGEENTLIELCLAHVVHCIPVPSYDSLPGRRIVCPHPVSGVNSPTAPTSRLALGLVLVTET